jgi:transcriptional regulator of arginine metabolism
MYLYAIPVNINSLESAVAVKEERQKKLLAIVRERNVATQAELVSLLKKAGFTCTQVSVSRDIHELRLAKRDGLYAAPVDGAGEDGVPPPEVLKGQMRGFLKRVAVAGSHLIIVSTLSGTAMGVALYIDHSGWPGVVGTVAGDDTVFVAVSGRPARSRVLKNLKWLMEG